LPAVKFTANTGTRAEPDCALEIKEPAAGFVEAKLIAKPVDGATTEVVPVEQETPVVGLKPDVVVQPAGRELVVAQDTPVVVLKPDAVVQPAGRVVVVVVVVVVDVPNVLTKARVLGPK
jgi:hypothetical protein